MRKSDIDDLSCGAVFRLTICDCGIAGMHNQKIVERQHDKLSVYGIGKIKAKNIGNLSFVNLFILGLFSK